MDKEFLQGEDLEPYKVPHDGNCWWCGALADTAEHKFKHSDLRHLSIGGTEDLLWGDGEIMRSIRSLRKSPLVRFSKNLCSNCNNVKSQPFDFAYERFAEYARSGAGELWRKRYIDMQDVYGNDWPDGVLNLARYFVKHIGCRMRHDGYAVPEEFAQFLDGGALLPKVQMVLFKDRVLWQLHRKVCKSAPWSLGLWMGPAHGSVSRTRKRLTRYSSSLTVGYIGVYCLWNEDHPDTDPFYLYQSGRLHRRDKLPPA